MQSWSCQCVLTNLGCEQVDGQSAMHVLQHRLQTVMLSHGLQVLGQLHAAPLSARDARAAGLITDTKFRLDAVHRVRHSTKHLDQRQASAFYLTPSPEVAWGGRSKGKETWHPWLCNVIRPSIEGTNMVFRQGCVLDLKPIRQYVKDVEQHVSSETGLEKPRVCIIRASGMILSPHQPMTDLSQTAAYPVCRSVQIYIHLPRSASMSCVCLVFSYTVESRKMSS